MQKRDGTEEFKVAGEPVRYQEEVNRLKKSLDVRWSLCRKQE